jgi:hypothetical protein
LHADIHHVMVFSIMSTNIECPAMPEGLVHQRGIIPPSGRDEMVDSLLNYRVLVPLNKDLNATAAYPLSEAARYLTSGCLETIDRLQIPTSSLLFVQVQAPHEAQPVHVDGANSVTLIAGGSEVYEFAPSPIDQSAVYTHTQEGAEAAMTAPYSIEMSPGDVIANARHRLINRLRNPSSTEDAVTATFVFTEPMPVSLLAQSA